MNVYTCTCIMRYIIKGYILCRKWGMNKYTTIYMAGPGIIKPGIPAFLISNSTTEPIYMFVIAQTSTRMTWPCPIVIKKQISSHHIAPLGASSSTLLQYWKVRPGLILGCWIQEKMQTQTKHIPRACKFKKERFCFSMNWVQILINYSAQHLS